MMSTKKTKTRIQHFAPGTLATTFRPGQKPKTQEIPSRFYQLGKMVNERDSDYFIKNPTTTQYTRQYIPGECWPEFPNGAYQVLVKRIGIRRVRVILDANGSLVENENSN